MADKLDIALHEASVTIVKQCADVLCEVLHSKFECVATIEGVELENRSSTSYQRRPPIISPEKRFEFRMPSGVKVSVWKADLINFQAEAVVNAANEDLRHYGGLAQALSSAGGPQIQKESDEYVKKHGKVKTGDAVALHAGSLPYKKIIHAVGPRLGMSPSPHELEAAKHLLKKTIRRILHRVEEKKLVNVAIPAISSGIFNYPLPECAHTIVSTVKYHYDNLPSHRRFLQEIFFVNHDDPTVQAMEKACHQIFNPHQHPSYSQTAAKNTRSAARTPPSSVQIGNVILTLKKGFIEDQTTDVIVNTAAEDRNLSTGQISSAILKKAGSKIQKEMFTAKRTGNVICTKGYQLNCKEVFHTICTVKGSCKETFETAEQILFDATWECLLNAQKSCHNSISFPAIGTGNLGFRKQESASIMSKAVAQFAEQNQRKLDVFFVIHPSDNDTYEAFEAKINVLHEKISSFMLATASGPKGDSQTSRPPTPKISLHGSSDESKIEAKKWLSDLFQCRGVIRIQNNFISHFSEQDHLQLSKLAVPEKGLSIEESFSQGHACITVMGKSGRDVAIAALQVEAMLCRTQKEFISEEEHQLKMLSGINISMERRTVNPTSQQFYNRLQHFKPLGVSVVKVEKVENCALKEMFDLKKKQIDCYRPKTMFQRISAQFCGMISRIGFQAECAPPEDPEYGDGIYFTRSVNVAMKLWKQTGEEYLYFVEAEVLKGRSVRGKPGIFMPPPVGKDPNVTYDGVDGGPDVSVIFSGYQALPKYIITCKRLS
ncbi:protein mono-ADP-ribosyltransferase PARP9-like [Cyprinodon tularosa]|uniref:protein mono-ADP-ribosyltransferase PARP9-like n=1 Tax=Cyprinodon tularosa TaxID=77115 RepID=UPI0018E26577|nr:protein mono-ADP-ribosyltransferase PARP9-like [Cyprinodon tularosa]